MSNTVDHSLPVHAAYGSEAVASVWASHFGRLTTGLAPFRSTKTISAPMNGGQESALPNFCGIFVPRGWFRVLGARAFKQAESRFDRQIRNMVVDGTAFMGWRLQNRENAGHSSRFG